MYCILMREWIAPKKQKALIILDIINFLLFIWIYVCPSSSILFCIPTTCCVGSRWRWLGQYWFGSIVCVCVCGRGGIVLRLLRRQRWSVHAGTTPTPPRNSSSGIDRCCFVRFGTRPASPTKQNTGGNVVEHGRNENELWSTTLSYTWNELVEQQLQKIRREIHRTGN